MLDKYCAKKSFYRVSEHTLLSLSFWGGTLGAVMGQQILRHKTKKQPFKFYLKIICIFHIFLFIIIVIALDSLQIHDFFSDLL
jgi:uncharacterized membrane protein YsdA (DUF1294 family)